MLYVDGPHKDTNRASSDDAVYRVASVMDCYDPFELAPIPENGDVTIIEGWNLLPRSTNSESSPAINASMPVPRNIFSFTRLATAANDSRSSLTDLYHQFDETTRAEEEWDPPLSDSLSSSNITMLK